MLPKDFSPVQSMLTIIGSVLMIIGILVSQSAQVVSGFARRGFVYLRSISGMPAVVYGLAILFVGLAFILIAWYAARPKDQQ